jgi:chaperone modulatory protein CbpM
MIQISAVVAMFTDLDEPELLAWIDRGWVRPQDAETGWVFQDIDVARVRLIYDLHRGMSVQDDMIPLVLSLLDQVYDLRGRLRTVLRAIDEQPDAVREPILAALTG